jgi:optic atrophy 3 protein
MPLVKLGYLLIRTVAKPIAGGIKRQARDHPAFRNFCIGVAQSYHRAEVRLKRGLETNKRKIPFPTTPNRLHLHEQTPSETTTANIKPLDEAKAVEVGSEFIGEALVFIVAGTLLVMDQLNNRQKEQERRNEVERRFGELYVELSKLREQVSQQHQKIEQIERQPKPGQLPTINK